MKKDKVIKDKKTGLILMIALIVIVVLSGGFLLLYSLLNNYKDIVNKGKKENIIESYVLSDKTELKDDYTRLINSYTFYEDNDFIITINRDKFIEIKSKEKKKTFVVEEVVNAKKFLYNIANKRTMFILNELGEIWYFHNNDGLIKYSSFDDSNNTEVRFKKITQMRDGGWSAYEQYDEISFSDLYLVKEYSGYYEFGISYGFNSNIDELYSVVGLSTNNNYYEMTYGDFDELKPIKSLDEFSNVKNRNVVGYVGDNNFGYMLDISGNLMLFRESNFLSNEVVFENNSKKSIYKMFVYYNQREYDLYVITTDNKLYTTTVSEHLTISDKVEFIEVKGNEKIKSIQYKLPKNYKNKLEVNEEFNISDLTIIFNDDSKIIIDKINYSDTFSILEEE